MVDITVSMSWKLTLVSSQLLDVELSIFIIHGQIIVRVELLVETINQHVLTSQLVICVNHLESCLESRAGVTVHLRQLRQPETA